MDWRGRVWGYTGSMGMVEGMAMGYFLWDLGVSLVYFDIAGFESLFHAIAALLVTGLGFVSSLLSLSLGFRGYIWLTLEAAEAVCQLLWAEFYPLRTLDSVFEYSLVL